MCQSSSFLKSRIAVQSLLQTTQGLKIKPNYFLSVTFATNPFVTCYNLFNQCSTGAIFMHPASFTGLLFSWSAEEKWMPPTERDLLLRFSVFFIAPI